MDISLIIGAVIVGYSAFVLWKFTKKRMSANCCQNKIEDCCSDKEQK